MYFKRVQIEPLPYAELHDRSSFFWNTALRHVDVRDLEIVNAYCDWQGTLQEAALIKRGLDLILKHAMDDSRKLHDALVMETRSFARQLIVKRLDALKQKQNFVLGLK